jgi:cell shape-determining protein MreC
MIAIFLLMRKKEKKIDNSSQLIQDHLFNISKSLDDKLSKNFETNSQISRNSNKTIEDITKKLTSLEETNKQIKDI